MIGHKVNGYRWSQCLASAHSFDNDVCPAFLSHNLEHRHQSLQDTSHVLNFSNFSTKQNNCNEMLDVNNSRAINGLMMFKELPMHNVSSNLCKARLAYDFHPKHQILNKHSKLKINCEFYKA
uniref:Uncharacterized protein n=1 Tax=Romanomermis culicivorax TaxID=13658 RepID=A0A915HZG8_ROMCU